MTIYGTVGTPLVLGQPISPNFGVQNAGGAPAPTLGVIPQLAQVNAPQKPLLDSVSRGEMPRNANIAFVSGVLASAGVSNQQGDPMSVDEAMGSGNGAQVNLGVPIPNSALNPAAIATAGINNQEFVDGVTDPAAVRVTGPTPTNIETLTSAPLSGATLVSNITLVANSFAG